MNTTEPRIVVVRHKSGRLRATAAGEPVTASRNVLGRLHGSFGDDPPSDRWMLSGWHEMYNGSPSECEQWLDYPCGEGEDELRAAVVRMVQERDLYDRLVLSSVRSRGDEELLRSLPLDRGEHIERAAGIERERR